MTFCLSELSLSEFYGHAMLIGKSHSRKERDVLYLLRFIVISFPDLLWTKPKARSGQIRFALRDHPFSSPEPPFLLVTRQRHSKRVALGTRMVITCQLTIGSCFSVHHRVMEHAGSLESTKEA